MMWNIIQFQCKLTECLHLPVYNHNYFIKSYIAFKVPSVAPTNLQVLEKGSTSITLTWKAIIGQVSGYKIRYKKEGNGPYAFVYVGVSHWQSQWQANITDLEKNTAYEIQVAGYTEDGIGPYSGGIIEKTKNGKC